MTSLGTNSYDATQSAPCRPKKQSGGTKSAAKAKGWGAWGAGKAGGYAAAPSYLSKGMAPPPAPASADPYKKKKGAGGYQGETLVTRGGVCLVCIATC